MHAVGRLFQDVFRKSDQPAPQALLDHFQDIYFAHPWRSAELPSLVIESERGVIHGFIGVIPVRLMALNRPITAAVAGTLMVRDPLQRPLAGARLLRTFLSGPQTLSIGDTANWTAQTLWERLGGQALPISSLEWFKVLRPGAVVAQTFGRRTPRLLNAALRPLGFCADAVLGWTSSKPRDAIPKIRRKWTDRTVDDRDFLAALKELTRKEPIRLDLDGDAATWLLGQAALKQRHGALARRVVLNAEGRPIGAYLVYCRAGDVAETLHIAAETGATEAVIASLIGFVAAQNGIGVRGKATPQLTRALFQADCIFRHRCSAVVHTRDEALRREIERGAFSPGGLFGETWTRLVSDDFDAPSSSWRFGRVRRHDRFEGRPPSP